MIEENLILIGQKSKNNIAENSVALHVGHDTDNTLLTLSLPSTTLVPYANSLDLDGTLGKSASHPDPSWLTVGHFTSFERH